MKDNNDTALQTLFPQHTELYMVLSIQQSSGNAAITVRVTGHSQTLVSLFDSSCIVKPYRVFSVTGSPVAADFVDRICAVTVDNESYLVDPCSNQNVIGSLSLSGSKATCQSAVSSTQLAVGTDRGVFVYELGNERSKPMASFDKSFVYSVAGLSESTFAACFSESDQGMVKVYDFRTGGIAQSFRTSTVHTELARVRCPLNTPIFTSLGGEFLYFWDERKLTPEPWAFRPVQVGFSKSLEWSSTKNWTLLNICENQCGRFQYFCPTKGTAGLVATELGFSTDSTKLISAAFIPGSSDALAESGQSGGLVRLCFPNKPSLSFRSGLQYFDKAGNSGKISTPSDICEIMRSRAAALDKGNMELPENEKEKLFMRWFRRSTLPTSPVVSPPPERRPSVAANKIIPPPRRPSLTVPPDQRLPFLLGTDSEGVFLTALLTRNFQVASSALRALPTQGPHWRAVHVCLAAGSLVSAGGSDSLWKDSLLGVRGVIDLEISTLLADTITILLFIDLCDSGGSEDSVFNFLINPEISASLPVLAALADQGGVWERYLEFSSKKAIEMGLLEGIPIVWLSKAESGVKLLLGRFLDLTHDVQTISHLIVLAGDVSTNSVPRLILHESLKGSRFSRAVNGYLNLLRSWQFWSERSRIAKVVNGSTTEEQILECFFCQSTLTGPSVPVSSEPLITSRCPGSGCHKPLPNCAVCLEPVEIARGGARLPFSRWTVWCVNCLHGGHQAHLTEWFTKFQECPVAGCSCQCANAGGS